MIYATKISDFYHAPTALDVVIEPDRVTLRTLRAYPLNEDEVITEAGDILGTPSPLDEPGKRPIAGTVLSYERLGWDYEPPMPIPEGTMLSALGMSGCEEAMRLDRVFPLAAGEWVAVNVDHASGAIGGFIVNRPVLGSFPSFLFIAGPNGASSWEDGDIVIGRTMFGFRCNRPVTPIDDTHPLHAAMLATVKAEK